MYNLLKIITLVFLLFIAACSSTTVGYNINNYETGKVLPELDVVGINYSNAIAIHSLVLSPEITSDQDFAKATHYGAKTNMTTLRLRPKINDRTRIQLSAGTGWLTTQVKGYIKHMLSNPDSDFGLSVMPGIGFSSAGSISLNRYHLDVKSQLLGLEFLVPMSYTFAEKAHLTFGPKFYYFYYNLPCEYDGDFQAEKTFREQFFSPGFCVGFKYHFLSFETTVISFKEDTEVVMGISTVF